MNPMQIDTEEKARLAVESWRTEPARAQVRNLTIAIEAMELNQMYYEQKGSEKGVQRMEKGMQILKARQKELNE